MMNAPASTERLYYHDATLRQFQAKLIGWSDDGAAVLDRTAFYPASGGQDHDTGSLGGTRVTAVEERDGVLLHVLAEPLSEEFAVGSTLDGCIDWERRFDLMQHHTGQHLLSAMALKLHGWETVSVHIGVGSATVEFAVPSATAEALAALESRVNGEIAAAHPVTVAVFAENEAPALRKMVTREGPLRVVTIQGIDQSACGGTHVSSTAQIGCLLLGASERIRKQLRVEFVCGLRAVRRSAMQRDLLVRAAAALQCQPDQLPQLLAQQRDELLRLAKRERALSRDLSAWRGRDARHSLTTDADGRCCAIRWVNENPGEAERTFATAFCEAPGGVLLTVCASTGAFLLATNPSSGVDAARWLTEQAAPLGAKGGGSAAMVSGRLAGTSQVQHLAALLPGTPAPIAADID
ncbi:MAG: hypothetical protein KIT83_09140 [Bryobacterales bacterium]|nr:hypothetical protein [Bryobacterales bacterium]